jgi:outer membrane immunogenic protein
MFVAEDRAPRGQKGAGRVMRWLIGVLIVLVLAPRAFADDLDAMLGPPVNPNWFSPPAVGANWNGFYLGGSFGYSDAGADFSNATQSPIAYALRETTLENEFSPSNWQVLGSAQHGAADFGGFFGYNYQIEHLVLGLEANYQQASLSVLSPNTPISRLTPADSQGDSYLINITGSGSVTDLNFGTVRARAGWTVGPFLPYAFGGFALGHGDVNVLATVSGEQNPPSGGGVCSSLSVPPCTPFAFTTAAGKNGEWLYGFTLGAGLDVAVTKNFFLRAEYEYVQFAPVSSVLVDINSVRVGAAFKF